jgi:hypothetical protein
MARRRARARTPSYLILAGIGGFTSPTKGRALMQPRAGGVAACLIDRADRLQKTGIILSILTQLLEASFPFVLQSGPGPLDLRQSPRLLFRLLFILLSFCLPGLLALSLLTLRSSRRGRSGSSRRLFAFVSACSRAQRKRAGRIERRNEIGCRRCVGCLLTLTRLTLLVLLEVVF